MRKISVVLLASFLFQAPVHAADRIRIGFPDITGPFVPLPIGQKMGFFQEEGLQPEILWVLKSAHCNPGLSQRRDRLLHGDWAGSCSGGSGSSDQSCRLLHVRIYRDAHRSA